MALFGESQPQDSMPQDVYGQHLYLLTKSKEFNSLSPADQKAAIKEFTALPEDDRMTHLEGLTYPEPATRSLANPLGVEPRQNAITSFLGNLTGMGADYGKDQPPITQVLKQSAKDLGANAIDLAAQAGAGTLMGKVPGGRFLAGPVEGLALVGANRLNRALGLREGEPLGPPSAGELLSAAVPTVVRGVAGGLKATTKPAQSSVKEADKINLEGTNKVQEANTKTANDYLDKKMEYDQKVLDNANINRSNYSQQQQEYQDKLADWQKARQAIIENHKLDVERTLGLNDLSNAQKVQEVAGLTQARNQRLAEHQAALQNIKQAQSSVNLEPHEALYDQARNLAQAAPPASTDNLEAAAQELGIRFGEPAEGMQSPFTRITDALQEFSGRPVPLQRLIETQKALGKIISKSSGAEQGAARKLWGAAAEDMKLQTDPASRQAIDVAREAAKAYMRNQTMGEFGDIVQKSTSPINATDKELTTTGKGGLFNKFETFKNGEWTPRALTPEEIDVLEQAVKQAPVQRVGAEPRPAKTVTPEQALEQKYLGTKVDLPLQPQEPTVSPIRTIGQPPTAPAPTDYKPAWETVAPTMPRYPWGPIILSGQIGGNAGAAAMGMGGSYNPLKWAGMVVAALPTAVSRRLLSSEAGIRAVRTIIGNKQTIDANTVALLTKVAEGLGEKALGKSPSNE